MAPHRLGEITTATVLFTDVVDSTATRIRLGEEDADRLYARHDRVLRAVVRVHRCIFIKSVGDGIMAVFDSATSALKAAAAIQQAVVAENRRSRHAVEIRSGLSSGDVIWTTGDIQGIPPIEAARLASAAQAGQILCSDIAMRLAFGRAGLDFKDIGELELKGLDKPLRTLEVQWWQHGPPPAPALPAWMSAGDALPFVGRAHEQAALSQWLANPPAGASVAIVAGDPGIGKTRLVTEVVGRAAEQGGTVLSGRCSEPASRPFQPIAEAIEHLVEHSPAVLLQAEPDGTLGELVRLVPELADPPFELAPPPPGDAESQYFRLIEALTRLLDALGSVSPVVFVVDDVQWASEATVRLLVAVLRRLSAGTVQVLATMREAQLDISPDTARQLKDLLSFPNAMRLSLGPLAARDIAEVLTVAGADPVAGVTDAEVAELAERVVDVTGGNAFLVTETVRELRSGAGLPVTALPETITLFMAGRVDRAGPTARELIHLVACGDPIELAVLREATRANEDEFVAALEEAAGTGLVVEHTDGMLGMAHALARTAVEAGLSPARVAALHRRIVGALRTVHPAIATSKPYLLAGHLAAVAELGGHDDVVRARDAAEQAARHATDRLAHHEAAHWYELALALHDRLDAAGDMELAGGDERRVELLVALGDARWCSGHPRARATLLDAGRRARDVGRGDLLIGAALAGDRGFFSVTASADDQLIALLSDALGVVEPVDVSTRAELTARLAAELTWHATEGDRRFALADEALALARESGDHRTLAKVLGLRNLTISSADTLEQRLADSDELVRLAAATGDDALRFQAAFQRAGPLLAMGDLPGVGRQLDEAGQLADSLGQPQLHWLVEFSRAGLVLMAGDVPGAEQQADRALRLGTAAGRRFEAIAFYSRQLAEIRRLQGRLGELVGEMQAAAERMPEDPGNSLLRYLCEAGADGVDRMFDDAISTRGLPPRRDLAQRASLDNLAFVAARLGRDDALPVLYAALEPWASTFGHDVIAHPCGHHFLAVLAAGMGDPATAGEHFGAAASLHERAGTPLLLAESLIEWRDLLSATGAPHDSVSRVRDRASSALAGRAAPALSARLSDRPTTEGAP